MIVIICAAVILIILFVALICEERGVTGTES